MCIQASRKVENARTSGLQQYTHNGTTRNDNALNGAPIDYKWGWHYAAFLGMHGP